MTSYGIVLLTSWLNDLTMEYGHNVNDGKLALFSKNCESRCELGQIIPITIKSHLLKILDKCIKHKLENIGRNLLKFGRYQSRFKEEKSTADNVWKVLEYIK